MKTMYNLIGNGLNLLSSVAPETAARIGFNLICRPMRRPLKPAQLKFLNTASQATIKFQGESVQLYRWGNGPRKILLIHGWSSNAYRWKPYINALDKSEFTIYALDAPGHGQSTGNFMNAIIYSEVIQLAIEMVGKPEIVIGHSLGAFASFYTFFRHPGLMPEKMISLASPFAVPQFFEAFSNTLNLTKKTNELIFDKFRKNYHRDPDYYTCERFVANLPIPGLVIHDEDDVDVPVSDSIYINTTWKNSSIIITQNSGHNLKTKEVLEAMFDFIYSKAEVES